MNKLVAVLGIVIILLSVLCGVSFYQISAMQTQINDLENHNSVLDGQVSEYQNQTGQLETQIDELENQISELETQLDDLEAQNLELQNQKRVLEIKSTNLVKITEFVVNETSPNPPAGVGFYSAFFVTVENFGTKTVEGLKVVFDIQYQEIFTGIVNNGTINIGTLNAGESRTVSDHHQYAYSKRTFVVTLLIDDIILDRFTTTRE